MADAGSADEEKRCAYKHENFTCSEKAWPGSRDGFCLYHATENGKDQETSLKVWEYAREKAKKPDPDFTGWHFPDAPADQAFKGVVFDGWALFVGATFSCVAWFDNATFQGNALFDHATFHKNALFKRACFNDVAQFVEVTFEKCATFSDAKFVSGAQFKDAKFLGSAFFTMARFGESASFAGASFHETASFNGAIAASGIQVAFDLPHRVTLQSSSATAEEDSKGQSDKKTHKTEDAETAKSKKGNKDGQKQDKEEVLLPFMRREEG